MNPTERFSNRVADYVRYRPSYPPSLLEPLTREGILTQSTQIADIGSGTGLLTQLLLNHGNRVWGVEPNADMRRAGEDHLAGFATFTSVAGTAETTTLPDASVDLITAGQAFHWFDRERAWHEFRRILRPPGWVVLIWHERLTYTPFLREYETLLQQYSTDYREVDHRRITDDVLHEFFLPDSPRLWTFAYRQMFDLAGVKGRLLSSSYVPPPGHPRHEPMLAAADALFARHQSGGQVAMEYETRMHAGRLLLENN